MGVDGDLSTLSHDFGANFQLASGCLMIAMCAFVWVIAVCCVCLS